MNCQPSLAARLVSTTKLIVADNRVTVPSLYASIARWTEADAEALLSEASRKLLKVGIGRDRNYYSRLIRELVGRTTVDICIPSAATLASPPIFLWYYCELTYVMCAALTRTRQELLKSLVPPLPHQRELSLIVRGAFKDITASSNTECPPKGVHVGSADGRRYVKSGFDALACALLADSQVANRIRSALVWLRRSLQEPSDDAAVVLASTALEFLLGFSGNESLRRVLPERLAFVLTDRADVRAKVYATGQRFYDARSAIVHGRGSREQKQGILVSMQRQIVLGALALAAQAEHQSNDDQLRRWCDNERWGDATPARQRPFDQRYLSRALAIAEGT